jgi:hypothetical protein
MLPDLANWGFTSPVLSEDWFMRQEVQEFTRACEKLVIFAHQNNGLMKDESYIIVNFIRAVEKRVVPSPPQPATPFSNTPPID